MWRAILTILVLTALISAAPVPKSLRSKERVVSNPAGDIHLLTDRDESVRDYFNRTRLVVGDVQARPGLGDTTINVKSLLKAKESQFVYCARKCANDEKPQMCQMGLEFLKVAPPATTVVDLLGGVKAEGRDITLIFRKGEGGLHHVVGYTTRPGFDFFGGTELDKQDGYSMNDLRFGAEKK